MYRRMRKALIREIAPDTVLDWVEAEEYVMAQYQSMRFRCRPPWGGENMKSISLSSWAGDFNARELRTKNHETRHEKAQTKHAGARGPLPVNRGDSR
jgi:hypothetical protein